MNYPALHFTKVEIYAQDSIVGTVSPAKILLDIIGKSCPGESVLQVADIGLLAVYHSSNGVPGICPTDLAQVYGGKQTFC